MALTLEDAIRMLETEMHQISSGTNSTRNIDSYTSYGYDIYLGSLVVNKLRGIQHHTPEYVQAVNMLMDAAWWFVGRGILRPGVKRIDAQSTEEGNSTGFSLTHLGRDWLKRERPVEVPVTSPSRMKVLFLDFESLLGGAFTQRANEAVHCYDGRQYLACCAMAGAAAESIVIEIAIKKTKNQDEVMRVYTGRDGRRNVERLILSQSKQHIKDTFSHHMDLLKYWRDQAAHGAATPISEEQAYLALVGLVRFARFAEQHWTELTT